MAGISTVETTFFRFSSSFAIIHRVLFRLDVVLGFGVGRTKMFRQFASSAFLAMNSRRFDAFLADVAVIVRAAIFGGADTAFGAMTIFSGDPTLASGRVTESVVRLRQTNQGRVDVGQKPNRRTFLADVVVILSIFVIVEERMISVLNLVIEESKFRTLFLHRALEKIGKRPKNRQ